MAAKVAYDTKWRKLKNFSKIYAKILEEERVREVALATAWSNMAATRKPSVTLQADGCLVTGETGDAILEKESGSVSIKQKDKRKFLYENIRDVHRSLHLINMTHKHTSLN